MVTTAGIASHSSVALILSNSLNESLTHTATVIAISTMSASAQADTTLAYCIMAWQNKERSF